MHDKNTIILLKVLFSTICTLMALSSFCQMPRENGPSVFGNEWIDYNRSYLRIPVGSDGWYTIGYDQLKSTGWTDEMLTGSSMVVYHNGLQIPIVTSAGGVFSESDQIIFYGRKNHTELEDFMFYNSERQMLNPEYSLFTDTSVYFLTLEPEVSKLRYQEGNRSNEGAPVSSVSTQTEIVYNGQFYTQASQGIINPDFNDLEGFATAFAHSVSRELKLDGIDPLGDSVFIEIGIGADLNTKGFSVSIDGQKYKDFTNEVVQSARQIKFSWPVNKLDKSIEITVQGIKESDRVAIAYVRVTHRVAPTDLDTSHYSTFRLVSPGSVFRLELDKAINRVYNLTQGTFYENQGSGAERHFILEGSSDDEFVLSGIAHRVANVKVVSFDNYLDKEFDYLIITSDYLHRDSGESDPIVRYADYRRSEAGGGFLVGVVSIEQLRDQYIYGIQGHPYAIRNFVGKLIDLQHEVRYVNIIGKGMGYGYLRSAGDHQKYYYHSHFVPTFGHYGSDNLLMAAKGQALPRIPVGRIPVTDPDEITDYLEKVMTYESVQQNPGQQPDREWMKRVMHFNGGDRNIFSIISNFMDGLGSDIQQDSFAAELVSYYKSSFGSTDIPERDEIFSYINDGAALISFFGHSASSSLDFNIDIIEEYGNQGKLPIFLALGCSSGNIFLPNKNLAERFILTPDIGSVLFLSTATSEYLTDLQNLARNFYRTIGGDLYGKPLGDVVKQTLGSLGRFQRHLQSVFVFTGDPAITSYHFDGPDFTFKPESVRLIPVRPSLVDDEFTMEVTIQNLGRRLRDTFPVLVRQELPNGEKRLMDTIWTNVEGFDQLLTLTFPITEDMEGKNTYYLTIDPENQIEEYPAGSAETNNTLEQDGRQGFEVFIQNTTLQLIYPYDMAIVPDGQPLLELFNGNVESSSKTYRIELDTTPGFSSSSYRSFTRTSSEARILFPLDGSLKENEVYYWRARWEQDSVFTPYHSFVYIPDRTGWNQSHYGQFYRDSLHNLAAADRKLEFEQLQNVYKLDHGYKKAAIIFNEINRPRFFRTDYPALNVSIFRPRKNDWVRNPKPGLYNSTWPVSSDDYLFTFVYRPYSKAHRTSIVDLIESEAEDGDYVIFWNTTNGRNSPKGETWAQDSIENQGVNLFNYFESEGASQIRALAQEDRRAYSLIYKKGEGVVTEILGDSAGVNIEYVDLYSFVSEGQLWSGEVDLLQSLESFEGGVMATGNDTMKMTVKAGSTRETVDFDADNTSGVKTGTFSNPGESSFAWNGVVRDGNDRTLPSFYWRVFGPFRPDWRISNGDGQPLVDTVALDDNQLSVQFKIEGRGVPQADSVLVSVELFNRNRIFERRINISSDQWGQELTYNWPIEVDYHGPSVLKVTVDPDNEWEEAQEDNNAVFRNFDIGGDQIAPTLEVLFDQQSILNGDIIAPNARISVQLADFPNDNLSVPPDFEFRIKKPTGEVIKIDAGDPRMTIETKKNGTELLYQSDFDENGMYELQVNVRDVVGNSSRTDYRIGFEVVLENSVSAILPYPNPFVDAVRFAYTLTGTDEPEVFRLMIYTVSGRLVKEITKAEFGPMRIGRHLSDFVWDGRDNWNQELAPGVYLYKVISRDGVGEDYEKYQINELEQGNYFKNGIGKMVKLR